MTSRRDSLKQFTPITLRHIFYQDVINLFRCRDIYGLCLVKSGFNHEREVVLTHIEPMIYAGCELCGYNIKRKELECIPINSIISIVSKNVKYEVHPPRFPPPPESYTAPAESPMVSQRYLSDVPGSYEFTFQTVSDKDEDDEVTPSPEKSTNTGDE